jgi:hypothetical protein
MWLAVLNTVPTLAPQTQFIAAIGNPASSSGTNAHEWYDCIHNESHPNTLRHAWSQSPLFHELCLPTPRPPRSRSQSAYALTFHLPLFQGHLANRSRSTRRPHSQLPQAAGIRLSVACAFSTLTLTVGSPRTRPGRLDLRQGAFGGHRLALAAAILRLSHAPMLRMQGDWWLEEHGLIMEKPDFPLPVGKYMVTGDREVTTELTIEEGNKWSLKQGDAEHDERSFLPY